MILDQMMIMRDEIQVLRLFDLEPRASSLEPKAFDRWASRWAYWRFASNSLMTSDSQHTPPQNHNFLITTDGESQVLAWTMAILGTGIQKGRLNLRALSGTFLPFARRSAPPRPVAVRSSQFAPDSLSLLISMLLSTAVTGAMVY